MRRYVSLVLCATSMVFAAAADPHDVYGTWATEAGTSHVEIADCGDASPCGTIVWLDQNALEPGAMADTVTDAKGNRVMGLKMLYDFNRKRNDWRGGTIYDPESGKTYGSRLKVRGDGKLQVKGCIGPVCQTQIWTRAE